MDSEYSTKISEIKEIYDVINKAEKEIFNNRYKSISLLEDATSLYTKLSREKGKKYLYKNCSDIPTKINSLIDKLMEYNT